MNGIGADPVEYICFAERFEVGSPHLIAKVFKFKSERCKNDESLIIN